jgi:hypothetical protein
MIMLVFCTVFGSYAMLWMTGTASEEAQQELQWFFSAKDLVPQQSTLSWKDIHPPRPVGYGVGLGRGCILGSLCLRHSYHVGSGPFVSGTIQSSWEPRSLPRSMDRAF